MSIILKNLAMKTAETFPSRLQELDMTEKKGKHPPPQNIA